jgi:hypothetical protein
LQADRALVVAGVSSPLPTVRDFLEPAPTPQAAASDAPTDADLERAIVAAVTAGAFDVARTLSGQLEDRKQARLPGNVVKLRGRM